MATCKPFCLGELLYDAAKAVRQGYPENPDAVVLLDQLMPQWRTMGETALAYNLLVRPSLAAKETP